MGGSFPKELRLLKSVDFQYLRKGASFFNAPYFRFYFKKTRLDSINHGRIGFSVSRKVGNACYRNYIKRLLREYYRTSNLPTFDYDVLVIASPRLSKIKKDHLILHREIKDTFDNFIKTKLDR